MNHVFNMSFIGVIAGMIVIFWNRIIQPGMIFAFIGRWIKQKSNKHYLNYGKDSSICKLLQCIFCLSPWVTFLLCSIYIIDNKPSLIYCIIGLIGAVGASNLISEIAYRLRAKE